MSSIEILLTVLGTAGGSSWITSMFNRKKVNAEADNIISKTYQGIIENLREEMARLQSRLDMREQRELEYLKIINEHKKVEGELRTRIVELESEMSKLKHNNEKTTQV